MKTRISWAIWMVKWCQNELKWRLESHEEYWWTNDAKMNSNVESNPMSNMDERMMPKCSSNEDLNPMSNIDGQMMPKWTQMNSNEDLNTMSNMDGQMIPKWTQMKSWISWAIWMDKWCQNDTQMKTWIPWAIWMDKWCQNELKWRLKYHEQHGWTNDAKMNSNEDLNPMSNMDGQMMPKWIQMKSSISWALWMDKWCKMNPIEDLNTMSNMDGQMMPKWTQMKTWIPWAIWMDKWCQNKLKWRLESHEQYGWTNDAKMNSNEDSNIMSNMDGQMMPKWTQMKTWIPWAIFMDKCCKWWTQNELKWRLEPHEQYGWTNDAKMNSNEESNPMSNMDGQMMPKWTQMKTWIRWAIWMDKWCQNKLHWWLEYHEQYGWTNAAKMNSNEDLNPMCNIDGQMMPKWTQMKSSISWELWMDKWCKMNPNEDLNTMSNMGGQMMPKWTQMN